MTKTSSALAALQRIPVGDWLFIEFPVPVDCNTFGQWVRDFVDSSGMPTFVDIAGKKKVTITFVSYVTKYSVAVGSLQTIRVAEDETAVYRVVDTIYFGFQSAVTGGGYLVSGNSDPIVLDYFMRMLTALAAQWPEAAAAVDEYKLRLLQIADAVEARPPSKRGRKSQFSVDERDAAVEEWERQKKGNNPVTLPVFLSDKFGDKDEDSLAPTPLVSESTFYEWRSDYFRRHQKDKRK
jgi:hypothetical protein